METDNGGIPHIVPEQVWYNILAEFVLLLAKLLKVVRRELA